MRAGLVGRAGSASIEEVGLGRFELPTSRLSGGSPEGPITARNDVSPYRAARSVALAETRCRTLPGFNSGKTASNGGSLPSLELRKDPNSEGSVADILAQFAMQQDIMADADSAVTMINRIESVRRQVLDTRDMLAERGGQDEIVAAAEALNETLVGVEQELFQMRATGTGQDGVRYPSRLMSRLAYLLNTVGVADVPPTDQEGEVHVVLKERLRLIAAAVEAAMDDDLEEFNRMIQSLGLRVIS